MSLSEETRWPFLEILCRNQTKLKLHYICPKIKFQNFFNFNTDGKQ